MKLFPQLALVSAIAISGNAMAMQALDDSALSAATGQDGITIAIKPPTNTDAAAVTAGFSNAIVIDSVIVRDKDGIGATTVHGITAGAANQGAIQLGTIGNTADSLKIETSGEIVVKIDAASNGGNAVGGVPVLNINVALPTQMKVTTGDIYVTSSAGFASGQGTARAKVLDSISVSLGGAALNIQLGNDVQGAMIKASGTITGGLTISNLALRDNTGTTGTNAGAVFIDNVIIRSAGVANLVLDAEIDATSTGLVITTNGNNDVFLQDVRLGATNTAASIGDVELIGIQSSGTEIRISGH